MSSPTVDPNLFAVNPVTPTNSQTWCDKLAESGQNAALTMRAVVAVTLLGAGMWYLLWRVALYFEAGR
jgi:hypothetical protein